MTALSQGNQPKRTDALEPLPGLPREAPLCTVSLASLGRAQVTGVRWVGGVVVVVGMVWVEAGGEAGWVRVDGGGEVWGVVVPPATGFPCPLGITLRTRKLPQVVRDPHARRPYKGNLVGGGNLFWTESITSLGRARVTGGMWLGVCWLWVVVGMAASQKLQKPIR